MVLLLGKKGIVSHRDRRTTSRSQEPLFHRYQRTAYSFLNTRDRACRDELQEQQTEIRAKDVRCHDLSLPVVVHDHADRSANGSDGIARASDHGEGDLFIRFDSAIARGIDHQYGGHLSESE